MSVSLHKNNFALLQGGQFGKIVQRKVSELSAKSETHQKSS